MAKNLFDAFNEDFEKEIKQIRSNPLAYEKATLAFEQKHGFTPFPSYDSFRKRQERKRKRR